MKHILYCIFLVSASIACAQSTIYGRITTQDEEPLSLIDIILMDKDSVIVYNEITNEKGIFSFEVKNGAYLFQLQELGNPVYNRPIEITSTLDLGDIILAKQTIGLQEVMVDGKKRVIERQVDRYVFHVENSVAVTGGDALDALNNTPGVLVDEDKISLAGKSSVRVLVNDRLMVLSGDQLTHYLKSIPADNIKKIEVITTPPARYEAEGNSGLINIVLKDARQNAWSTSLRSSYRQGHYASPNTGVNFSFQKNKWSILTDVGFSHMNSIYRNEIKYDYPDQHIQLLLANNNYYNYFNSLVTVGYEINKNHHIGAQYNGNFLTGHTDGNNNTFYRKNDVITSEYPTIGKDNWGNDFLTLNANYVWKMDTLGRKMSVDVDFLNTGAPQHNLFGSNLIDYEKQTHQWTYSNNNSNQDIKNYSGKIDFNFPLSWAVLETGAKIAVSKTKNSISAYFYSDAELTHVTSGQDDLFHYDENIQSAYISFNKEFNKKWSAKIGLRAEYTQTESNSIKNNLVHTNDYFKLFPTAYLQYKPTEDHSYSMNFSRRLNRPSFGDMNPNRWYTSPLSYVEGNPFLQPSFSYNFELNYGYKSLFNLSVNYSHIQDNYTQTVYHNVEDLSQIMKRENYANEKYIGTTISSTVNITPWWDTTNEFSLGYVETKPYIDLYDRDFKSINSNVRTTNNFRLNTPKTLLANINYVYYLPTSGEYSISARSNFSLGLKYLAFDKKLTIALNANDVFKTYNILVKTFNQNIHQSFNQYYDSHSFRLSLTYKFGNNNIQVSQRESGNQEEINRAS